MLVFVHSSLPIGGAEILRKAVVSEILNRDIDVRLCLISGGGAIADELKSAGVTVDELGSSRSVYNPLTTWKLARYFKKTKPEIVQSSQFNSNFHTRIAAKLAGVPVVVCEEHGLYHWKGWWHRLADRLLSRWCDKIVAVSKAVYEFNVEKIGIPEQKIEILSNCLNTERLPLTKSREEIRSEFGFAPDSFVLGHVGSLREEKAHDVLLQAFALLRVEKPEAKLLLVGDGPLKTQLKQLVETLGLSEAVFFAGERPDVSNLLKAMDIFAFPSRNESLGIALLEAMFIGVPVVATRTGGIPEIVTEGVTGLLVEVEDVEGLYRVIQRLSGDDELRSSLADAARQYVFENHSPQEYADKLLKLHNELSSRKD